MADVYHYNVDTGEIVPDTSTIQQQVIDEYKAVFGSDLNTDPKTPQGALIVTETLARTGVAQNNSQIGNQLNPNVVGGILLDATLALTGTQRTAPQFSTVSADLTGEPSTVIPANSQAQDTVNFEIFNLQADVTLDLSGNGVGTFVAVNDGPIAVAPGTLTQILNGGALGWETVTNPTAGTLGAQPQSDVSARTYRRQTLAAQGASIAEAVTSQIYATPGVIGLKFRENFYSTTTTIDGVSMVRNSVYACVDGGTDLDVANSLTLKKGGGSAYNNGPGVNVSQSITQPFSGQVMTILFDRPNLIGILVQVTAVRPSSGQDPTQAIKNAISDYVAGLIPGVSGISVGDNVSAFEMAGAIVIELPGIYIKSLKISLLSPVVFSCDEIPIAIYETSFITQDNISVILV